MGGYTIDLPRNTDGTFNVNEIVQVDGTGYQKWLDNPNTLNNVEVWENALSYQVYIPQVLIPPALDDDNKDGIDDWIDDRGDRFSSKTGYLHDTFMKDDGETYPPAICISHYDNLAGTVDSGWVSGPDQTFGDDEFEKLGSTHFTIKALYEGKGREGQLEISKGGTLVVEEIFGGSPWVVFSHSLSSKSEGSDLSFKTSIHPSVVKIGIDTVYLKHTIEDKNEPHSYNINFDPFISSLGYSDANITTLVGAKDPCNLIEPAIAMPAIVDPGNGSQTVNLIPMASQLNKPELSGFPKSVSGTFVEVRVELSNCSEDNWKDVTLVPTLPSNASLVMEYVASPRPLVPDDNVGVLNAGWRFNQPEGEVLMQLGHTLKLIQPTRRAYFVFLLKVDNASQKGIYEITFTIGGQKINYTGINNGSISYTVPSAKYCVTDKNTNGSVKEFQKLVLGQTLLKKLSVSNTADFKPIGEAKWSFSDIDAVDYPSLKDTLKPNGNSYNLGKIGAFPSTTNSLLTILQPGVVDSYNSDKDILQLTNYQKLTIGYKGKDSTISSPALSVTPIGPKVRITHVLYSINGRPVEQGIQYESDKPIYAATSLKVKNYGADISKNTTINIIGGQYFDVIVDSLPQNAKFANNKITISFNDMIQGEEKSLYLYFKLKLSIPKSVDITRLINTVDIEYTGTAIDAQFKFTNDTAIVAGLYDFEIQEITYSQINENIIHVSATAFNKGRDTTNIWFRIYPIIGQGAYEFQLVEKKISEFAASTSVTIESDYTLPNIGKSLEMITRIDDNNNVIETTELNNTEKTGFILTSVTNPNQKESFNIGPNPFQNKISFRYNLVEKYNNMVITIFDAQGHIVKQVNDCPANIGSNMVLLSNLELFAGNYVYKIESESGVLSSGKIVCENNIKD